MPRRAAALLSLLLGVVLHVDWHLARPLHHRLSLDWSYHWAFTAALFAVVGCIIARTWPTQRWRLGAVVFLASAIAYVGALVLCAPKGHGSRHLAA